MKLSNFLLPSPAWLSSLFSLLIAILLGLQALESNFTDFFGTVDCPECITAMQKAFTGITFIVALMKPFTAMKQSFLSSFLGGIAGTKRDQNGRFVSPKGGAALILLLFCSTLLSCNTQPGYYTEQPTYSTPIVNTNYVHNTSPAYSTPVYVHSPAINIHRTTVVRPARASFFSRVVNKPTVTVNKTVVRPARTYTSRTNYRSTSFRSFASRPSFSSRRR
jgi:hypothetical protein